jgi:hypothetical protein
LQKVGGKENEERKNKKIYIFITTKKKSGGGDCKVSIQLTLKGVAMTIKQN